MGQFRLEVSAVGSHGCDRHAKPGDAVGHICPESGPFCPDCFAYRFVKGMLDAGYMVESAKLTHWPGTPTEVVDDLASGKRVRGAF